MITDKQIREIIELTAEVDINEMVWGFDTEIDHIDNLIADARTILEKEKSE